MKAHPCENSDAWEPVIFRLWRDNGEVIALFPRIPADYIGALCQSYERVGEHGGASIPVVLRQTRPARPAEYRRLKRYLEQRRGYRLLVRQRISPLDHCIRRREAREFK